MDQRTVAVDASSASSLGSVFAGKPSRLKPGRGRGKNQQVGSLKEQSQTHFKRKEERVTFPNARNQALVGVLFDTESQDVCILCHGMYDNKMSHWWPDLAERLAAAGLSSLRFDFSGNGESEGDFKYGNTKLEAEDIRAALQFLQSRGKSASAVAGHSKAGSGVICYAAKYRDIPKVVNISGRFDNQTGIKERFGEDVFERLDRDGRIEAGGQRPFTLTKEDMQDRLALDMRAEAAAIPPSVRVFTIHGSEDATIPEQAAHDYARAITTHELHIVQGGDHCFTASDHRAELLDKIVQFVCR